MSSEDFGPGAKRWAARLARLARQRRLHGAIAAALDVGEPLGPLGAQMLWIAQPALGLFVPRADIDALARLLDQPGGVAWLRDQIEHPTHTEQADDTGATEHA